MFFLMDDVLLAFYTTDKVNQLTDEQMTQCVDDSIAFKELLYKQKEFTTSDVNEFNRLVNECNLMLSVTKYGTPIFVDEIYAEPENP